MLGNVEVFAERLEDGRDFGFEAFAERSAGDVFIFVITTGEQIKRPLTVAGRDAGRVGDLHLGIENAARGEHAIQERAIGFIVVDGFPCALRRRIERG